MGAGGIVYSPEKEKRKKEQIPRYARNDNFSIFCSKTQLAELALNLRPLQALTKQD
jgi:hypothetical protein